MIVFKLCCSTFCKGSFNLCHNQYFDQCKVTVIQSNKFMKVVYYLIVTKTLTTITIITIILIFLTCLFITCTHSLLVLNPPLPRTNLPHSTFGAAGKQILSRDVRSQFPTGVNANSVCHSLHSSKSLWKQSQWYNVCIRMHRVTGIVNLGVSTYQKKSLTTLLSCPTTVNVPYCGLTNELLLQNMSCFVWIS